MLLRLAAAVFPKAFAVAVVHVILVSCRVCWEDEVLVIAHISLIFVSVALGFQIVALVLCLQRQSGGLCFCTSPG